MDIEERMAEVVNDVKNIKEEVTDIKITNAVILTKLDAVIEQNNKQDSRETTRDENQKKIDKEQFDLIDSKADKADLDALRTSNTSVFKEVSFWIISGLASLVIFLISKLI